MFTHFKRTTWRASLLGTLISLLVVTIALAASGNLDPTFDLDGRVITNVVPTNPERQDYIESIAIQSNGKIVAAGYSVVPSTSISDFAVTRYNADGSLDITFSGDGRLITNFGAQEKALDAMVQSNGKIIAAGERCNGGLCDVALARYNANGTFDTTFSGDGKQITDFGGGDNGAGGGLAIQSDDGKIVVAGYASNGTDDDFAVYRYNANGSLDTTFSGDGIAVGNFGLGRQDYATDLALQSDGKIIVVGATNTNPDGGILYFNFAIARLNADGTADTTFSVDGRQTTDFGGADIANGIALQENGKIVVVGYKDLGSSAYFAIARYNSNGDLDKTFNSTGKKVFSIFSGFHSWASDVIIQSNGKIVITGATDTFSFLTDFALVRLKSDGGLDTTFSGDGKVTVNFAGEEHSNSLALQPLDGKYVLGGYTDGGVGKKHFTLARVLP